jgi:hypothetical protein
VERTQSMPSKLVPDMIPMKKEEEFWKNELGINT